MNQLENWRDAQIIVLVEGRRIKNCTNSADSAIKRESLEFCQGETNVIFFNQVFTLIFPDEKEMR